jgi:hypothetical protein
MGLRFRRSWGVLPGVRLNLGLKSGSVSFGTRGLHYTVGTKGQHVTVGLPGTGLHWTQTINFSPFSKRQVGGATQAPGYVQPAGAGSPQVGVINQLPGAQTLHAPQLTQPNQSPGPQTPTAPQVTRPHQSPLQPPTRYRRCAVSSGNAQAGLSTGLARVGSASSCGDSRPLLHCSHRWTTFALTEHDDHREVGAASAKEGSQRHE